MTQRTAAHKQPPAITSAHQPSGTMETALRQACQARLKYLQIEIDRTGLNPSADAIHDLRVATRRATEVLRVGQIAGIASRRSLNRLIKALRTVRRAGGAVRDCDVMLHALTQHTVPARPSASTDLQIHRLTLARSRALEKLSRQLHETGWPQQLKQVLAAFARDPHEPSATPLVSALKLRLSQAQTRVQKMIRRAEQEPTGSRLHRTRIAGKQWRYALELLPPLLQPSAIKKCTRRLAELKAMQQVLGDIHDMEMLEERLAVGNPKVGNLKAPTPAPSSLTPSLRRRRSLLRCFFQMPLARELLGKRTKISYGRGMTEAI